MVIMFIQFSLSYQIQYTLLYTSNARAKQLQERNNCVLFAVATICLSGPLFFCIIRRSDHLPLWPIIIYYRLSDYLPYGPIYFAVIASTTVCLLAYIFFLYNCRLSDWLLVAYRLCNDRFGDYIALRHLFLYANVLACMQQVERCCT